MVRKKSEFKLEERANMRNGDGTVKLAHIWKQGDGLNSKVRMYSTITLEPGCSIGYHEHNNEEEIFYVVSGKAKANDNGQEVILDTGDSIVTRGGEGHAIACLGDEPLVLLAIIPCY